mmetsp:Transcript_16929/g.26060  ORF Transcript_16929/g.26060 Transcript_16929/m.26060 type:complete len:122 (-) Transcript_16929:288-653(-)
MWAIVFFVMMLLLGIDSIFSLIDVVITYCWDSWPWARKLVPRKMFSLIGVLTFFFVCIPYTTNNGWWYMIFVMKNSGGWVALFFLSVEAIVLVFMFGFDKLDAMIFNKTGEKVPRFMKPLI